MSTAPQTSQNHLQIDHFAKDCQDIIRQAQDRADELKSPQILSLHLFSAAMKNESVLKTFKALSLSEKDLVSKIEMALDQIPPNEKDEEAYFSREADRLLMALGKDSSSSDLIHIERLFGSLIAKGQKPNAALFQEVGSDGKMFCEKLKEIRGTSFGQLSNAQLLRMEEEIGKRMIGQREAVEAVCRVVRRGKVGLSEPGKPLAVLMFVGCSGTGKTELAKALCSYLYGSEKNLIRLDMSEYSEKHQVARMIGSGPGYISSEDGGQLTNAIMANPQSVILLDEWEKSHPDIGNIFLSVFDDGRLTDGKGRTADFSQSIIIMTSNIGSREIMSFNAETNENEDNTERKIELKEMLNAQLLKIMRPELINRIDEVAVFSSLSKMEIGQIVEIQLRSLKNVLAKKGMKIEFDQAAKEAAAFLGYSRDFGARPLRRMLTKYVRDPLATKILEGVYSEGSLIQVSYDGEHFQLN